MNMLQRILEKFTSENQEVFIFTAVLCLLSGLVGLLIGKVKYGLLLKKQRQDAVKRSKSVLLGQITEQIAPLLPKFPCHVKDVKFLGKPIDFIGFKTTGDSELIEEVLFIEVKTGDSTLSKREESLKKAIEKGKVRYVEYRYKGEVAR